MGGVPVKVLFAGMAPGFAGLWQVNLEIPSGASGAVPAIVTVAGTASNTVTVWVAP
jgi:uncharacterized protein (TIGR03437 family)